MPGFLIEAVPFSATSDQDLAALLGTLRAALDPDAFEMSFFFPPTGRWYRRRVVGLRDSGLRPLPLSGPSPPPDDGSALVVPFGGPGDTEGTLQLIRRRPRPWTGAERTRFELIRPLVEQLVGTIARRQADRCARRRLFAAAEETDAPVLAFDATGTILYANGAADDLISLQTEQGLAVLSGGRRQAPLLSHLIQLARTDPAPRRERLALSNGRSLEARVVEVPPEGPEPSCRLVVLQERAALTIDDVRPQLLARGVSGREADVVAGVLKGLRNAEIATELFISEYTVKDHLKHVFAKLGVASRGALLRELYAAPAEEPAPG